MPAATTTEVRAGPTIDLPLTTKREDVVTVLAGLWLIIGLFLDGYAHQHLISGTESFLTPWHAVFYSGFAATSAWLALMIARRRGPRLRARIPRGYMAAVIGLGAFCLGAIGDGVWHTLLGVEVGIDALLSPTHLVLMVGMMAIVTAPYRAALDARDVGKRGVALVSLGVGVALAAFFLNFVWGLGDGGFRVGYQPASGRGELAVIAGVATVLVTTIVFTLAATLALRLGRLRFGTFAVLFVAVAGAVHVAFDEELVGVIAAFFAGLALDVSLGRGQSRERVAVVLPISIAALWTVYFALPLARREMAWPAEIWSGAVVLATLGAAVMGYLASVVLDRDGTAGSHRSL